MNGVVITCLFTVSYTHLKGPLTGLVGEVVMVDGRSKIAVRLNMLGCACADMPVGYVEKIENQVAV